MLSTFLTSYKSYNLTYRVNTMRIYADNAATTKLDIDAFEAMKPFLLEDYGNASQPYSFARSAKNALKQAREAIARCIGALPEEVFFTSGGTESNNWVIKSSALADQAKGTTITSQIEHHALLHSCASIEQLGYPVVYLPVTTDGQLLPKTLKSAINDKTRLVSVMMVNNEIGTIEPISELAEITHKHGAIFHTDAVQAVGHIPIDVKKLGVDMLSASGHKFNAPKGVGFLYIKEGINLNPYVDGGAQEFGMRAGTENVAAIVAMAKALEKNCSVMKEVHSKLARMEEMFLHTLDIAKIDYILNRADLHLPGNINISIKDANGEMLLHRLDLMGICISTGSACDSTNTQISHVIQAIGIPQEYAEGTIRVSFGKDNDERDATKVANAIAKILRV